MPMASFCVSPFDFLEVKLTEYSKVFLNHLKRGGFPGKVSSGLLAGVEQDDLYRIGRGNVMLISD